MRQVCWGAVAGSNRFHLAADMCIDAKGGRGGLVLRQSQARQADVLRTL